MKKTEMTFVRFDAQDVVTTSGWNPDADPTHVAMLGSNIKAFNSQSTDFDFAGWGPIEINDSYYFGYNSTDKESSPTGSWDACAAFFDTKSIYGYELLADVDAIWEWLKTHGYNGQ